MNDAQAATDVLHRLAVSVLPVAAVCCLAALALTVGLLALARAARPGPADLYCCLCTDEPCSWGCCHRSCGDHAVLRWLPGCPVGCSGHLDHGAACSIEEPF